jgi:tetratricopeptide (TPR) repeat protein
MNELPLNPYVAGGPLSDPAGRGFYGREDIFDFVRTSLLAERRTPILLYGQRRIGKTSILRQIPNHLPPELACVYYDLQGKASMSLDQVLYGLARAITDILKIPRPPREEATEENFVADFLPRAIAALDNRPERLVLLFDEFDVIDEPVTGKNVDARGFIGFLGNLVNIEPRIGFILVVGRKTEELSEEFNSTLLKGSVQKKIVLLNKEQATRLVHKPSQGYLHFTDDALERIYSLAAGQPFCTQVLCYIIWAVHVREGPTFPIKVAAGQVDDALLPAIEFGTLGLNWIFDGLTSAAHRLFLSALAEVADPIACEGAPLSKAESALTRRHIALNTVEFNSAPRELERWDVIKSDSQGLLRFVVPMVGAWIQRERSLDRLEKDVRYANPRAYNYYELAVEAHGQQDLGRAILDYKRALVANPLFLEAQKGLATALGQRRQAGDLDAAVEAFERVLEIDPESSRDPLVQVLAESIEYDASEPDKLPAKYARLSQLDPEGPMQSRTTRLLRDRAASLMELGSFKEAAKVFEVIGETELARLAVRRHPLGALATNTTIAVSISALLLAYFVSPFLPPVFYLVQMALWSHAAATLGSLLARLLTTGSFNGPFLSRKLIQWLFLGGRSRSFMELYFRLTFGFAMGLGAGGAMIYVLKEAWAPQAFGAGWAPQAVAAVVALFATGGWVSVVERGDTTRKPKNHE